MRLTWIMTHGTRTRGWLRFVLAVMVDMTYKHVAMEVTVENEMADLALASDWGGYSLLPVL
jgi:hypothetical protein